MSDPLNQAIEHAAEAVVVTDAQGVIVYANPAVCRITGYAVGELLGEHVRLLKSGQHDAAFYDSVWNELLGGRPWRGIFVNRKKDGSLYREEATISPVRDAAGAVTHYVAVKRDLTAEDQLRDQVLQAQKMEALGRLAGGVAHDFNNLLMAILGFGETAGVSPASSAAAADLGEFLSAARRARSLTEQLLDFSRVEPEQPDLVNLGAKLVDMDGLLRRLAPAHVAVRVVATPTTWVRVSSSRLEQVVLNLAVNAVDAMASGGSLEVRARIEQVLLPFVVPHGTVRAGTWAVLSVSDTGCGMSPEAQARMFNPFFTTKSKGTGLGLATVYGVVQQAGGRLRVSSAPGRGTTLEVYFPLARAPAEATAGEPMPLHVGGDEHVWVVEDDPAVRMLVARALDQHGYSVLAFGSAEEALGELPRGRLPELLVADLVLPGIGGAMLAERMRRARPELAVLVISGYPLDAVRRQVDPHPYLQKPFTAMALAACVRQLLDGRGLDVRTSQADSALASELGLDDGRGAEPD